MNKGLQNKAFSELVSINDVLDVLNKRKQKLEGLIKILKRRDLQDPHASLIVKKRGDKEYYYKRDLPISKGNVTYIKKKDISQAKGIAQSIYEREMFELLKDELECLRKMIERFEVWQKEYEEEESRYHSLITPLTLSNAEYAKKWESKQYKPSPVPFNSGQGFKTDKGDIVRSKSELIIANTLYARHIPYRYEDKLTLGGKYYRPDFKVLNVRTREEIIWEHFGMLDNINYVSNNLDRLDDYIQNGYSVGKKLIISHESEKHPLSMVEINNLINDFCV